jgi:hypothetical protein
VLLASEISTGHEIGLVVVAVVFIAFALIASFVAPRFKPDFPGPNGIGPFVIGSIVMFVLMVAAVNFFG